MTEMPIWIHIGLGKTGTTSFQKDILSTHHEILYLGKNWIRNDAAKEALLRLARQPERRFNLDNVKSIFSAMIAKGRTDDTKKRVAVLSEEDFTTYRFLDPAVCAHRLKRIFSDAKILLVIREPVQWLKSMYFFRLSLRFPETLDGFNEWVRSSLHRSTVGSDIGQLQIGAVARTYADLFGTANVTVMLYEDLRANPESFIVNLCSRLGTDTHETIRLYRAGIVHKSRITRRQERFLRTFKLVRDGHYAEYINEVLPLLNQLGTDSRAKAELLLPADLTGDRAEINKQFRFFSEFLDRAARHHLVHEERADAAMDEVLAERIRRLVEPGFRYISSTFGVPTRQYFHRDHSQSLPTMTAGLEGAGAKANQ